MDSQTQKAGACVFIAIMLIITFPSLNTELAALSGSSIHTAIQIVTPIAWMLGVIASLAMAGYITMKG